MANLPLDDTEAAAEGWVLVREADVSAEDAPPATQASEIYLCMRTGPVMEAET